MGGAGRNGSRSPESGTSETPHEDGAVERDRFNRVCIAGALGVLVGCGGNGSSAGANDASGGAGGGEDAAAGGGSVSAGGEGAGSAGSSNAGDGGAAGEPPPSAIECVHVGSGVDYQVGPGKTYENLGDVPFESLVAGDTVRVFYRPQPYHEKIMIAGVGTAEQPIRVCGVAGPNGELPVLDGNGATTRPQMDFPFTGHQVRGLVIIGHAHDRPYEEQPSHIVIEALELTGASPENGFTDKSGAAATYSSSAAGIFVQRGDDITVRGCSVHDNNNGIFMGTGSGTDATRRVLIEANHIYHNGGLADYYEHNTYNEVEGIVYQFNHFGPPRAGADGVIHGSNIKDRSAGTVIRYNWLEDGGHLIDLVDAQEAVAETVAMPGFHETFVYGNVLIRNGTREGTMIHYGGDSGIYEHYRKGTLHFYENTVVVKNQGAQPWDTPAVFELSTNDERLEATNNIFYGTHPPTPESPVVLLGRRDNVTAGIATFTTNWVSTGWTPYDQIPGNETEITAIVTGLSASMAGTEPGFNGASIDDYTLKSTAPVISAGTDMTGAVPPDQTVTLQYVPDQSAEARPEASPPTLGAMGAP